MGFKTDTSFLRFLTMGALGVRTTVVQLKAEGFKPIELERYCGSNKIWMTKVKRLRLPDLLCVRTGVRFEVRAKSDLKIRMSDAEKNLERRWDAGNRDDDLIAFIAMRPEGDGWRAAEKAVFVDFDCLRKSVAETTLGPAKSASEGAERDRVWPSIVPSRNGTVQTVSKERLVVEMSADGDKAARMQTYALKGKHPYVKPGDKFVAGASFLAGLPKRLARLEDYRSRTYDPLKELNSKLAVDRYAAAKAIPHRSDLKGGAVSALEALLAKEQEERVALEAAGAAAVLGSAMGRQKIEKTLWGDGSPEMRMEAVLILTELGSSFARTELSKVVSSAKFTGDEIRQAAVWGLGKAGLRAYDEVHPFIDDSDDNVAMHAIMAFGRDTPSAVIARLVGDLQSSSARRAGAASETLRMIGSEAAVQALAAHSSSNDWIVATLGRMPPDLVRRVLRGSPLLKKVEPFLLLNEANNWLGSEARLMDLAFLSKQDVEV
jgi:hypothetical protein